MKIRSLVALALLATASFGLPACSLLNTTTSTPSTQVLQEVSEAETAYLTAVTIINIRSHGNVSADTKVAEQGVFALLSAAKDAANAGDTVTVQQKLDLFNAALLKFNEQYTNVPAIQP